jgi:hypothetical protein
MRKFGTVLAVAAGAALTGPAALATAPRTPRPIVSGHHIQIVKHLPRSGMKAQIRRSSWNAMKAQIAVAGGDSSALAYTRPADSPVAGSSSCPPGQSTGPYCLGPPAPDTLFETISGYGTASEPVTTSGRDTILVAFVQSDGPKSGGQSSTVSGAGLTWIKVASQNKGLGDAEVWFAMLSSHTLSRQTITATASIKGFDENLSIVSFSNASGIGATATSFSSHGAPTATITTTQPNSWVWASGNDWGGDARRTAPAGQTAVIQALDLTDGKAFWTQTTNNPTPTAGTRVTINDTAPANDPFNLALVEIL